MLCSTCLKFFIYILFERVLLKFVIFYNTKMHYRKSQIPIMIYWATGL